MAQPGALVILIVAIIVTIPEKYRLAHRASKVMLVAHLARNVVRKLVKKARVQRQLQSVPNQVSHV